MTVLKISVIHRLYRFNVSLILAKHLMYTLIIWIIYFVSDDKKNILFSWKVFRFFENKGMSCECLGPFYYYYSEQKIQFTNRNSYIEGG